MSFIDYIYPINLFTQLFGSSFVILDNHTFKNYIKSIFLAAPMFSLNIYCVINMSLEIGLKSTIHEIGSNINNIVTLLVVIDIFLSLCINITRRNKIKFVVCKLNQELKYTRQYERKRYQLILTLYFSIILYGFWSYIDVQSNPQHFLFLIFVNFNIYVNIVICYYHRIILNEVKSEFHEINASLESITNSKESINFKFDYLFGAIERHQNLCELILDVCKIFSFKILLKLTYFGCLLAFAITPTIHVLTLWNISDNVDLKDAPFFCLVGIGWTLLFLFVITLVCDSWRSIKLEVSKYPDLG